MDESLFTIEADRGSAALRRLARSWTIDADELDELVQMSWVLAWEKRDTYRGDGDFVGWLLAIGRTVCTRERRRRRRERTEPLSDEVRDFAEADHVSERRARARDKREDDLLEMIMCLSDRQRGLIIWHHGFGGSIKDMAKGIGRSTETVKATLAQARKRLNERAEEYRKKRGGGRLTHLGTTRLFSVPACGSRVDAFVLGIVSCSNRRHDDCPLHKERHNDFR